MYSFSVAIRKVLCALLPIGILTLVLAGCASPPRVSDQGHVTGGDPVLRSLVQWMREDSSKDWRGDGVARSRTTYYVRVSNRPIELVVGEIPLGATPISYTIAYNVAEHLSQRVVEVWRFDEYPDDKRHVQFRRLMQMGDGGSWKSEAGVAGVDAPRLTLGKP